jgi:hypothetical protein
VSAGRRFNRGWLVLVAVVGSLLAMELLLQGASLVVGAVVSQRQAKSPREGAVVLCIGDSHTYGLPLPEAESYPSQLQVQLDRVYGPGRFQVVNLGIPSVNSGFVAKRLERQLAQLGPELVIVWVGINNLWNAVDMQAGGDRWLAWRRWLQHSKLFRLASIAWYSGTGHQYDDEGRSGWYEGEAPPSGVVKGRPRLPNAEVRLERDLVGMGELARSFDAEVVLVGYPLANQAEISRAIERAAGRLGAPYVDTAAIYARARQEGIPIARLVDERAGPHPSALLYGLVVDQLMRELRPFIASAPDARTEP